MRFSFMVLLLHSLYIRGNIQDRRTRNSTLQQEHAAGADTEPRASIHQADATKQLEHLAPRPLWFKL